MSTPSNLNGTSAASTDTKSFFNNTNLPPISVSQNVDDAVVAYFEQISDSKEAARALAAAVILTSVSQGVDPMSTLQQFMKMDKAQLNSYTTMFLNLNRVGTSYLGINNSPTVSKYVARMIRP
jgi:hypothetical protein